MMALPFAPSDLRGILIALIARAKQSLFVRNAFYLTSISGVERVAALVQTILIARALGITEYGIYGLLFSTIGYVSSVMGLQMGSTATVFVARYRRHEKAKAGAVIQYVMRFAWIVALLFLALTLPFVTPLSHWLLKSSGYTLALTLGCLFLAGSLLSGVQDGIVEGFEDFRSVAIARLVGTLLTLAAIYPSAVAYGLNGVVVALLAGVVVKYGILAMVAARHRREQRIPKRGSGVSFLRLVRDFSLPSMLVNLLSGAVMWFGIFWLSRQPAGFAAVAIVNVGLQWRGPVLLLTGAFESVAIPTFSRHAGEGTPANAYGFKRKLYWLAGVIVIGIALVLVALGHPILSLYGDKFRDGWWVFALIAVGTIPRVIAGVHMQDLMGRGRMWHQLVLQLPRLGVTVAAFLALLPAFADVGYALALLAGSCVYMASALWDDMRARLA